MEWEEAEVPVKRCSGESFLGFITVYKADNFNIDNKDSTFEKNPYVVPQNVTHPSDPPNNTAQHDAPEPPPPTTIPRFIGQKPKPPKPTTPKPKNPYLRPALEERQHYARHITKDQFIQLREHLQFTAPPHRDHENFDLLLCLCWTTGLRVTEALTLTPLSIDFAHRKIKITWQKHKGPDKSRYIALRPPERTDSQGLIHQDPYAIEARLKALIATKQPLEILFPYHRSKVWSIINKGCVRLGFHFRTQGFHLLRHGFVTHALWEGAPIPAISKAVGHSKLETTVREYAAQMDDAAAVLQNIDF